jgi:RNA polymerase sigma-70 factor (ECF subfamily)
METISDTELAALLRERSPEAHAFAFREWEGAVRAASYRVLRSHDSVDDVVQRVFEELWRHPERYDPSRAALVQYLALQGRSRSIDLLRSEISRARRESADGDLQIRMSGSGDDAGSLRSLLDRLPSSEREVIQLAYFGQLTYNEVALKLALPEGTVKSRIRKGLMHLRSVVAREGDRAIEQRNE